MKDYTSINKKHLTVNINDADVIILIDVFNMAFRQITARLDLVTNKGEKYGHIFGSVQSLSAKLRDFAINKNKTACFVFCIDGYPKEKHKIFPEYKQGRTTRKTLGFDPTLDVTMLLGFIPGIFAINEDEECDDVIATLVNTYKERDCIVLSTDKDMWALSDKATVITFKDEVVTKDKIFKSYGVYDPNKISIIKAIYGDASDKIKKATLPKKSWEEISKIINISNNIDDFYTNLNITPIKQDITNLLIQQQELIKNMYKIIKLRDNLEVQLTENTGDQVALLTLLEKYGCKEQLLKSQSRFF